MCNSIMCICIYIYIYVYMLLGVQQRRTRCIMLRYAMLYNSISMCLL